MTDTTPALKNREGWTWLHNSRKWHYFRNYKSLCGKFMLLAMPADLQEGNNGSPDNCVGCARKLGHEA